MAQLRYNLADHCRSAVCHWPKRHYGLHGCIIILTCNQCKKVLRYLTFFVVVLSLVGIPPEQPPHCWLSTVQVLTSRKGLVAAVLDSAGLQRVRAWEVRLTWEHGGLPDPGGHKSVGWLSRGPRKPAR